MDQASMDLLEQVCYYFYKSFKKLCFHTQELLNLLNDKRYGLKNFDKLEISFDAFLDGCKTMND